MKQSSLFIFIFVTATFNLFATHYKGGEITYRITGNYTIEATVTTYTKISYPSNLADRDSITISWGDGTTSILPRANGVVDGSCTGASPCGATIGTDLRRNIYTGTHLYPGAPAGTDYYVLGFTDENLIGGISNIANGNSINVPLSVSSIVYMSGNYNVMPGGFDASPVFLNPPVYYGFVSQPFTFNSATYDPDGDSLSYALVSPQQGPNSAVPIYFYPDSFCRANGQQGSMFQLDTKTGDVTWTAPCTQGFFQFAIAVREFRCGLFIGEVVRNMQVIILPDQVRSPVLSALHDTVIQPGQLLQLSITANDSAAYSDSLQVLGAPFSDTAAVNRPVFHSATGNPATGTFSWQPDTSYVRPYSYLFTVIATNNFVSAADAYPASHTGTFRVWVADTTAPCFISSVNAITPSSFLINIFPNPAADVLHVQSSLPVSNLLVTDLMGRQIMNVKANSFDSDISVAGLEDGMYLLSITSPGLTVTRRFVKVR